MFNVDGMARPASYAAKQIHFVVQSGKELFNPNDMKLRLPNDKEDAYLSKVYLYCEAIALLAILNERQKNEGYEELLIEYEKLIFPPTPTAEGLAKMEALKLAIKNFIALNSEKKEFSWSMKWFHDIGHDETNPATLVGFVVVFREFNRSLQEMIDGFGPPNQK